MNSTSHFALSIQNLWWRYPTYSDTAHPWVLRDIDLQVEQGECFGIAGASGAGKTTLCRMISGIIPSSVRLTSGQLPQHFRGSITLFDEPVTAQTARRQQVGMVQQDPENQFLRMSVLHELALGLQIQGLPSDEILHRVHQALKWVGLEHLWKGAIYLHPSNLSGGQKQRIALAAFLALRPRLLILDEPTSDLDPIGKREVIETIAQIRREHAMTLLLIEQDPDILSTFCDRIALLHEGRVELIASPANFYAEREILEKSGASVGDLTRISWHTGLTYQGHPPLTIEEAEVAFGEVIEYAQQDRSENTDSAPTKVSEIVARAENVEYRYDDGTLALQEVDFMLYRGEMLALLGPNGSGKTTFAQILAGLYVPSRGRVEVLGQNLASRRVRTHLPRSVGYVFQNPDAQLFRRKVSDEIDYGLRNLGIDAKRRKQISAETLEAVHLSEYADEDPLFLSKGQRQRLAVAAILAMGPEILIVDEPTTGQDYRSVTDMMRLMLDLQQQGKTIVLITHDMSLVAEYCQRVVTFLDGRPYFTGTPEALFENQAVLAGTGLRQPPAVALSTYMREKRPNLPFLMTVEDWVRYLNTWKCG